MTDAPHRCTRPPTSAARGWSRLALRPQDAPLPAPPLREAWARHPEARVGPWVRRPMSAGAVLATVLLLGGVGTAGVVGLGMMGSADHLGILDSPPVEEQARAACDRLNAEIRSTAPVGPSANERVQRIRDEDGAIVRLVSSMQSLGEETLADDDPAPYWVADWETLRSLRETYADDVAAGRPPSLVVPTKDDIPITVRMTELSSCTVVDGLAHPV